MREISAWAARLTQNSGIRELMEDLGAISHSKTAIRFGGGNPAHIPKAEEIFANSFQRLIANKTLQALLGDYQSPIGNDGIRELTAEYLSPYLGSNLKKENIAFFNGSQNAFSYLLNIFSGKMKDGKVKKILLPLVPDYIGYADQSIEADNYISKIPIVKKTSPNRFVYQMDQKKLETDGIGCYLLSSPTNPTGNIISQEDLNFLDGKANTAKIPLIIDMAYGSPFPALVGDAPPIQYKEGRTLSLSFSKVGLPGVRLGIIISDPETISILSSFASMGNLAVGNLGIFLAEIFFRENTLVDLSQNVLRPFYEKKRIYALEIFESSFRARGIEYEIHEPLGGFFLWLRFPALSVSNETLYKICKEKDLYFVSGHYFFPGLNEEFSHTKECIRLTYCREEEELARGAEILAEIVAPLQAKLK